MENLKIPVEGRVDVDFTDEAKDLLKKFVKATEGWVRDWQEYVRIVEYEYAEVTHWAELPKPAVGFSE